MKYATVFTSLSFFFFFKERIVCTQTVFVIQKMFWFFHFKRPWIYYKNTLRPNRRRFAWPEISLTMSVGLTNRSMATAAVLTFVEAWETGKSQSVYLLSSRFISLMTGLQCARAPVHKSLVTRAKKRNNSNNQSWLNLHLKLMFWIIDYWKKLLPYKVHFRHFFF